MTWEGEGSLVAGEAIVVGFHEPVPLPGALRVGRHDGAERTIVEELTEGGRWIVVRRYETAEEAAAFAFDRLGSLTAERHWGTEEWDRIRANVRAGALLRTASLLVWPELDLGADRWELVERLQGLGVDPEGRYWVDGVDGLPPPDECVPQLRREQRWWIIGVEERGSFSEWARFSDEGDACRRMFREVFASGAAVTMGVADEGAHLVPAYGSEIRAALDEVARLLDRQAELP